ncbi:mitochondrial import protein Pam17 [Ascodesmis nigricans]|uniref:Presequence translocated-associated motor subunit PAM17 n=1 Tax=Ascodesmis nigricans TaxID=341454 RepID=A0A4V3SI62_9PEZI|nr:mitochondrial import protein Pam17 [Ascodesmis nigricans]
MSALRITASALRRPHLTTAFFTSHPLPRFSSSTTTPPTTPPPIPNASTPNASTTSSAVEPLDWDSFLRLRKLRRRYNLVSSILTSALGTSIGMSILANKEIDVTQTIMGMDPLIVFALATVSSGAAGWLAGPALGGSVFGVVKSRYRVQMAQREKEFLTRIKKNRVDPSSQSMSNPVPDYYGEKIGSVQQYRQWLKDQRAYKLKREKFL